MIPMDSAKLLLLLGDKLLLLGDKLLLLGDKLLLLGDKLLLGGDKLLLGGDKLLLLGERLVDILGDELLLLCKVSGIAAVEVGIVIVGATVMKKNLQ